MSETPYRNHGTFEFSAAQYPSEELLWRGVRNVLCRPGFNREPFERQVDAIIEAVNEYRPAKEPPPPSDMVERVAKIIDPSAFVCRTLEDGTLVVAPHGAADTARIKAREILALTTIPIAEPHPVSEVQEILIAPVGIEKLKALRTMCASCNQGFYVEILDEVLALAQQEKGE